MLAAGSKEGLVLAAGTQVTLVLAAGKVTGIVHDIVNVSWEEDESGVDDHGSQSDENTGGRVLYMYIYIYIDICK